MKSFKLAQFDVKFFLYSAAIYYSIYTLIAIVLAVLRYTLNENITSTGFEFSSAVFIFVTGIVGSRTSFLFTQANNLTRKTLFWGTLVSMPLIAVILSFVDNIMIRIYNFGMPVMSFFDMIYRRGSAGGFDFIRPSSSISIIFAAFIWQLCFYSSIYMLGTLIGFIYYRLSKLGRILVSLSPVFLTLLLANSKAVIPGSFWKSLSNFLVSAFGLSSGNSYMAALSFLVISAFYSVLIWLLTRRLTIKAS